MAMTRRETGRRPGPGIYILATPVMAMRVIIVRVLHVEDFLEGRDQ